MSMEINRFSPAVGAEIRGVDLSRGLTGEGSKRSTKLSWTTRFFFSGSRKRSLQKSMLKLGKGSEICISTLLLRKWKDILKYSSFILIVIQKSPMVNSGIPMFPAMKSLLWERCSNFIFCLLWEGILFFPICIRPMKSFLKLSKNFVMA